MTEVTQDAGSSSKPVGAHLTRVGLAAVLLTQLMITVDTTIVNIALPTVQRDLGFAPSQLTWVITSYALVFGGFILVSGKVGSLIGARRALLIGVVVFGIASVLAGLAIDPAMLIVGRAVQGVGAALAAPSALVLIIRGTDPGRRRARAMSLFIIATAGGAAIGLVSGGVLTETLGWRSIFFVNIPIVVAVVALSVAALFETERTREKLDLAGAAFSIVAMSALVYGFTTASELGWGAPLTLATLGVAAVAILVLIIVERLHKNPILPGRLLRVGSVSGPIVSMVLIASGQFGYLYLVTVFTQEELGYSSLQTGLSLLPFTAALIAMNLLTPALVSRYGERMIGVIGMVGLVVALLWASRLNPDSTMFVGLILPGIVAGAGAGMAFAPMNSVIMHHAPAADHGTASSLSQGASQLGGAAGLALIGGVFTAASSLTAGANAALTLGACFPAAALVIFAITARSTRS